MVNPPLTSPIDQTQQMLDDLRQRFSSLPEECQTAINAEFAHLSANLNDILAQQIPPPFSQAAETPAGPISPQKSDYRVGMVLRTVRAGIFVRDLLHHTATWTPEIYELLGIDPSFPADSGAFMRMIHPADLPTVEAETQAAIQRGGTFYQEFRINRPDGSQIWVSSIGFVEHDAQGRPLTLTGINQDITERKATEAALQKAHVETINERNRLRAMMEALPVGVAIYDDKGGVLQSNQAFGEVWGTPKPQANSVEDYANYRAWWVETGEPIRPEDWAASRAVREGKTTINQYLEIQRFDGGRRFVLNSAAPTLDADGKITGCCVAIRDITERVIAETGLRKSERSLRESEDRFRVVLSALPITVYTLDRDLRYTWVYNPQHGGLTSEMMLGKLYTDVFPQVPAEVLADMHTVMEEGKSMRLERQTDIFGDLKTFLVWHEPVRDETGAVIGLIGAGLDITEQRRLEIERRSAIDQMEVQRQMVENREKERQEIAREIHDGPIQSLVALMFNLQVTREEVEALAVRKLLDHVSTGIKETVRELRDVVNDLRPPALLRFGLGKTLEAYTQDFRGKHPEIDVQVVFDLPAESIYFSEETTLSLYRVCQEGLNNIARHAQATQVLIRFHLVGKRILLALRDNGKGFSVPKDLVLKTQDGHFGLAGMNERVQALGGDFTIHSTPGAGTIIEVSVPLEENIQVGEPQGNSPA